MAQATANPSQTPGSTSTGPILPFPFRDEAKLQLISQGAEALLYRTPHLSSASPAALKYRPRKPYRHPTLDARLTRSRVLAEARVLQRCARERIPAPALLGLGAEDGWLLVSWVEGATVRDVLRARRDGGRRRRLGAGQGGAEVAGGDGDGDQDIRTLLRLVGAAVAKMHAVGIVHGDLTTSNMILRPKGGNDSDIASNVATVHTASPSDHQSTSTRPSRLPASDRHIDATGTIVLIDFGLAQLGAMQEEDRAVDLYVLERAFGSTHPELEGLFAPEVLAEYGRGYKGAKVVLKRLEDVRMRGRKKSMIG